MNKDNVLLVIDDSALRKIVREETTNAMTEALEEIRQKTSGTYTLEQVCEKFSCSAPTIYKKIREGILHPTKVGRKNVFRSLEVDNLLSV